MPKYNEESYIAFHKALDNNNFETAKELLHSGIDACNDSNNNTINYVIAKLALYDDSDKVFYLDRMTTELIEILIKYSGAKVCNEGLYSTVNIALNSGLDRKSMEFLMQDTVGAKSNDSADNHSLAFAYSYYSKVEDEKNVEGLAVVEFLLCKGANPKTLPEDYEFRDEIIKMRDALVREGKILGTDKSENKEHPKSKVRSVSEKESSVSLKDQLGANLEGKSSRKNSREQ